MQLTAEYDYVGIIDALPESERLAFHVSDLLAGLLAGSGVDQLLAACPSKKHVIAFLERRFLPRAQAGERFALHFISHGESDGLWVKATGEDIWWHELTPVLEAINEAMAGDLLVNFSSCVGGTAIKITDPWSAKAPFFGVVGPKQTIEVGEAIVVNSAFYRSLLQHADVPKAVVAANEAIGKELIYAVSVHGYRTLTKFDAV